MNKRTSVLFAIITVFTYFAMPMSAEANITMTCYHGYAEGYDEKTLACAMIWSSSDELVYPKGEVNWSISKLDETPPLSASGPYDFDATNQPNNRMTCYLDWDYSGTGLYFLHCSGGLYEDWTDENGYDQDWHPDTYKADSTTGTIPLP